MVWNYWYLVFLSVCVCVDPTLFLERNIERSPSISQFTLSPIERLSPINLFPLPCDHVSSSDDEGITVLPQPKIKSRFKEHFHYDDSIASESLQQDSN